MITKQYKAKVIKKESKFTNFYAKMIFTNFVKLSKAGFRELPETAGNQEQYRGYHHRAGSSVIIQNKNPVRNYREIELYGNIKVIRTNKAITSTKKSLDKIAGEEFSIEEVK